MMRNSVVDTPKNSIVQGGEYYGPSGFATLHGAPVKQKSSRRSHDLNIAQKLWETAERLTGAHYP